MKMIANQSRNEQLFIRAMANHNVIERDRLISYTTGEFYQDFSLFLTECDQREKEYKKIKG